VQQAASQFVRSLLGNSLLPNFVALSAKEVCAAFSGAKVCLRTFLAAEL